MNTLCTAAAVAALVLFASLGCGEAPEDSQMEPYASEQEAGTSISDPCPRLVGSWELVRINEESGALSGEYDEDPDYQEAPTLKILNGTHWMFIRQSAEEFVHAQGGRYTLEAGGFYTEVVEYSAIPANVGHVFEFECTVEGDSIWHHVSGEGDNRYDEVWRRVR